MMFLIPRCYDDVPSDTYDLFAIIVDHIYFPYIIGVSYNKWFMDHLKITWMMWMIWGGSV